MVLHLPECAVVELQRPIPEELKGLLGSVEVKAETSFSILIYRTVGTSELPWLEQLLSAGTADSNSTAGLIARPPLLDSCSSTGMGRGGTATAEHTHTHTKSYRERCRSLLDPKFSISK